MRLPKSQMGMTMWSAAFLIALFVSSVFLCFKIVPPYFEYMKVRKALDGVARDPSAASMSRNEIESALAKRFDVDNVTDVDLTRSLFIETRERTRVIRISYETVVPLVYNISALLDFQHVREIRGVE